MTSLLIDEYRRDTSTCAYDPDTSICACMRGMIICGVIGYTEEVPVVTNH